MSRRSRTVNAEASGGAGILKPGSTASPYLCRMSGGVECTLCRRRLREGAVGACGMRFNLGGALYTAAYGLSTAAESSPMEISQDGVWM